MPLSDIVDKNFLYSYEDGRKYSLWLKSPTRLVYSIHSGPMKGRNNYLSCTIQEIRPGEIFQVGLLEGLFEISLRCSMHYLAHMYIACTCTAALRIT